VSWRRLGTSGPVLSKVASERAAKGAINLAPSFSSSGRSLSCRSGRPSQLAFTRPTGSSRIVRRSLPGKPNVRFATDRMDVASYTDRSGRCTVSMPNRLGLMPPTAFGGFE